MDNDFDSVSWQNEPDSDLSRPTTAQGSTQEERYSSSASGKRKASATSTQAPTADDVDLAGIGDGRLDTVVDTPLKENDGSKDAYISFLVTTNVCVQIRWY